MEKLGPLCYVKTIRYEGKHKEFKQTASIVTTRVNPARTLAQKHQLRIAYRLFLNEPMANAITFGKQYEQHLTSLENIEGL